MSEYILVSDIHGNYPLLQKVVDEEGADAEYIVLGDIHGLNAYPSEVMSLLEEMNTRVVLSGNHDKAIFEYGEGHVNSESLSDFEMRHTLSSLSVSQVKEMLSLSPMHVFEDENGTIAAAHAKPFVTGASGYENRNAGVSKGSIPRIASNVSDDYDYVFTGHTHEQYSLDAKQFGHPVIFVNPGSLGLDGNYTTINTETNTITHKSVSLSDENAVKNHIREVLPEYAPSVDSWY